MILELTYLPNAAHRSGARKSIAVSAAECSDHRCFRHSQRRHYLANGHATTVFRGVGVAGAGAAAVVDDGDGVDDDGPTTVDTHSWLLCCRAQGHPAGRASSSCPGRESIRAAFLAKWKDKSRNW